MKRIITLMLTLALVVTSITFAPKKVEARQASIYASGYLKYIKLTWDKYKKAKKYIIHRAVVKDPQGDDNPKRSKYKVIKKTKKLSFKDKKVKKNKFYVYYIDVVGKKGKVIATSYDKRYLPTAAAVGLDKPEIDNWGNGEGYYNSPSKIYLYASFGSWGYYPKKKNFVFYRKNKNSSEGFKKIKLSKMKGDDQIFYDKTVKGSETYQYKCKSYVKKGKKKYYSQFSDVIEISAVNFNAALAMDVLSPSGIYENVKSINVDFKVSDVDKNNGKLVFFKTDADEYSSDYYCYGLANDFSTYHGYMFRLSQYSTDGKTWKDIPKNGVELPKLGSLYLRAEIKISKNSEEKSIYFIGPDSNYYCSDAHSYDECVKYYGPTRSQHSVMDIDFKKQKISIYQDWS